MQYYNSLTDVFDDLRSLEAFLIEKKMYFSWNMRLHQEILSTLQGFIYIVQKKGKDSISLIDKLGSYKYLFSKSLGYTEKMKFLSESLYNDMLLIIDLDKLDIIKPSYPSLNSPNYYKKQIDILNAERAKLNEELSKLKSATDTDELHKKNDELDAKEKELLQKEELLEHLKAEQVENEKRNDAISTWDDKISKAFDFLKNGNKNITEERTRLNILCWCYLGASVILILWLGFCEVTIYLKWGEIDNGNIPLWERYVQLLAPIPIAIGLLWGFVVQMNRAQVQLVILSKYISEIQYIEGILRAMNVLSVNIDDSINKVNQAMERLVENYLLHGKQCDISEKGLRDKLKEEKMPYEKAIEIVKEVSEIVKGNNAETKD